MRRIKTHKKSHHTKYRRIKKNVNIINFLVLVGVIFAVGFFITYKIIARSDNTRPLTMLPIPKTNTAYWLNPLTLPTFTTNVLGAEDIQPMDFILAINNEREKTNVAPLRVNRTLIEGAQMRADTILKHQNFSHQDPFEGIELLTVLPKLNYNFRYASENIGMGGVSALDFVNGFMHSTYHKENLLNGELEDTGVAIVTGKYMNYYVNILVQIFSIPGGKYESLGYSAEEISQFHNSLTDVNSRLTQAKILTYLHWFNNKEPYQEWSTLLARQKQILEVITPIMQVEQPLTNYHISLIMEYNENITNAPTSPPT